MSKITNFFKEVGLELRKITWPTRQETIKYTITVIVISVLVAVFLGFFDYIFIYLLEKFVF